MRDLDEDMVYERGQCWVGEEQFGRQTFWRLVRLIYISVEQYSDKPGGFERYRINSWGKNALKAEGL